MNCVGSASKRTPCAFSHCTVGTAAVAKASMSSASALPSARTIAGHVSRSPESVSRSSSGSG